MVECYIVTIAHSLLHLQLLLPITPPHATPTTHKHPKRLVSTISALAQMKWIIGISQQRRGYEREDPSEQSRRTATGKVSGAAPAVTLLRFCFPSAATASRV